MGAVLALTVPARSFAHNQRAPRPVPSVEGIPLSPEMRTLISGLNDFLMSCDTSADVLSKMATLRPLIDAAQRKHECPDVLAELSRACASLGSWGAFCRACGAAA